MKKKRLNSSGFTIIELMIALVVFSVILLIVTSALMGIGNLYFKGQTVANTQNIARAVISDIGDKIEFSGNIPNLQNNSSSNNCANKMWCATYPDGYDGNSTTVYAYCIGSYRYSFVLNSEMVSLNNQTLAQTPFNSKPTFHALYEDNYTGSSCTPLNLLQKNPGGTNAKELLLPNMRVVGFQINPLGDTQAYNISITLAYGDDDLLNPLSGTFPDQTTTCKGNTGQQFCAVTSLSSTINMRVE